MSVEPQTRLDSPGAAFATTTASNEPVLQGVSTPTRHDKLYFEDGNLIFQVENTLFNVHRSVFRCSRFFSDMFLLPLASDAEGQSDQRPIILDGRDIPGSVGLQTISAIDFENLVYALYPGTSTERMRTLDEWKSIMRLSTMLQFEAVRALAVHVLQTTIDPLTRFELGVSQNHQPWIVHGLRDLCFMVAPIPVDAVLRLPPLIFFKLTSIREKVRNHFTKALNGQSWPCDTNFTPGCYPATTCKSNANRLLSDGLDQPQSDSNILLPEYIKANSTPLSQGGGYRLCNKCYSTIDFCISTFLGLEAIEKMIKVELAK